MSDTMSTSRLLVVEEALRDFHTSYGVRRALDSVSFTLDYGKTVAIVGESGAGKSTLARLIAGLDKPTAGRVTVAGAPPRPTSRRPSPVQMVFQQPIAALNPLLTVGASIAEPLCGLRRRERQARVRELMTDVGLDPDRSGQRPNAFSGGQLQRVVIARALAPDPKLLLCDEPTSALDVSVQAQIINLLLRMQEARGFGCVLVTHDLGVARVLADDVLVLRDGRTEEYAPADRFFAGPSSEYARSLLHASSGLARVAEAGEREQGEVAL